MKKYFILPVFLCIVSALPAQDESIKTFLGHDSIVTSVSYSPDGKYIASGSYKEIKIWDVNTGNCLKTFSGHNNWVWSVSYNPDGKYLASGSLDKTIKIWDVNTGNCIKTFSGHNNEVWSVSYSPDCTYLASGSNDNTIKIWELYLPETIICKIEKFVNDSIIKWQKKDMFETTAEYKIRVNEANRQKLIDELTKEKLSELVDNRLKPQIVSSEYDADNEVYKLEFNNIINPIYVKVPRANGEAQSFLSNKNHLKFNSIYAIAGDQKIAILSGYVVNPSNNKKYNYDSKENITFKQQNIIANFEPVKLNITNEPIIYPKEDEKEEIVVGKSDVDINIPETKTKKPNTYALIIGNEDYTKYQPTLTSESNVKFAINDAQIFAQYCYYTLGIPKENIKISTNVISSQMKRDIEWLISRIKYIGEDVEIIFYYSGHGFPDENTKEKYLIPVDISGTQVTDGIKLSQLYKDLTQYKCKRVTVFLDACFSGSGREEGLLAAKSVKIAPKEDMIYEGNLLVFSSSKGAQRSFFYKEKQHGLFTYYLLKKLQETSGNITYGELKNYLAKEVPLKSIDLYQEEQIPEVSFSLDIKDVWEGWTVR